VTSCRFYGDLGAMNGIEWEYHGNIMEIYEKSMDRNQPHARSPCKRAPPQALCVCLFHGSHELT